MKVKGFIKNTFIEYPGKIASIVFLSGCNFRCSFCFNQELIFDSDCLDDIDEKDVFDFLDKQRKWIDALVMSGGEPTMNVELPEFIKKVKKMGLLVRLYTNGSNPKALKDLIENKMVDSIAMDIKAPLNEESYEKITGVKGIVKNVIDSVSIIMKSGVDYEFRTTVVPGLHSEKDVESIANSIKGAKLFVLQKFVPEKAMDDSLKKLKTQSDEEMQRLAEVANKYVSNVKVR
ncbi:MAG: anaerobic ribonucleoside-triphosphate reductase activating protein [Candidatus Aenigmatarchaeota archaeon]